MMTKQEEIKHLMALMGDKRGDTYFNQFFSSTDIEQMIQNIHDDFAVEMGCSFTKKAEELEKKLHKEQKAHDQDMLDFVEDILVTEAQGGNSLNVAMKKIGMDNTIKIKRKNKIALSEEELDYLVSKLD
ncbi:MULTISPECIES: hypothetical protein [Prevotellaceae]|uniref:hypothetical protein n=1 Tax=Prevotellaceae TaxID=171552 RepID=UPI000E4BB9F7|nr:MULTISPECIES: hypothetical protein [Prevotellaceae]